MSIDKQYNLEDKLFHVKIQSVNEIYCGSSDNDYDIRITMEFLDGQLEGKTVSFDIDHDRLIEE